MREINEQEGGARTKAVDEGDGGQHGEELDDTNSTGRQERRCVALHAEGVHERRAVVQQCIDSAPFWRIFRL